MSDPERWRGELVVVPGLCVSTYLRPACDALALAGFDAHLVVPPGWSEGGTPATEPRTLADLARPIADWLAADDLHDVTLVGQSVGAQIAAHVAVLASDRVRRLVLHGPVFDPRQRTLRSAVLHWASDIPREHPSLMVAEVPDWWRAGPRRIVRTLKMALEDRIETSLDALPARTMVVDVVVGERDPLSTRGWTASLVRGGGRHVVQPGLPHSAPQADPVGFARIVADLVDGSTVMVRSGRQGL